jgi:protein TonB
MISDVIQKRTLLTLAIALALHLLFFFWVQNQERTLEVPITAERISTQIGLAETPQPQTPPTPRAKPKPTRKLVTQKSPPVPKKALTTQASQELAVPKPEKMTPPVPAATPIQAAKTEMPQRGGASEKAVQTDIQKYINGVVRRIDRKKRYPRMAKEKGEQGTVRVKMTLGREGQLLHYRVVQKPPFERLSQATLASIQAATPFPPLPKTYPRSKITIEVPVRFRLANRY